MESEVETKKETPRDKMLRRTGECIATICAGLPDGSTCFAYAYERHDDGFDLCVCGHTQHSHRFTPTLTLEQAASLPPLEELS